jgi:hypothetical protein
MNWNTATKEGKKGGVYIFVMHSRPTHRAVYVARQVSRVVGRRRRADDSPMGAFVTRETLLDGMMIFV